MGRYHDRGSRYMSPMRGEEHSRRQDRGSNVEEPLVPALFYISIAGMAGSIIARKSKSNN